MNNGIVLPLPSEPRDKKLTAAEHLENYQAAYRASQKRIALAENVKYGTIFVAGLIMIAAILTYQSVRSERFEFPIISISLIVGGAVLVLLAQFWNSMCRRRARRLQTAYEMAANTSAALTNAQQVISPFNATSSAKHDKKIAA